MPEALRDQSLVVSRSRGKLTLQGPTMVTVGILLLTAQCFVSLVDLVVLYHLPFEGPKSSTMSILFFVCELAQLALTIIFVKFSGNTASMSVYLTFICLLWVVNTLTVTTARAFVDVRKEREASSLGVLAVERAEKAVDLVATATEQLRKAIALLKRLKEKAEMAKSLVKERLEDLEIGKIDQESAAMFKPFYELPKIVSGYFFVSESHRKDAENAMKELSNKETMAKDRIMEALKFRLYKNLLDTRDELTTLWTDTKTLIPELLRLTSTYCKTELTTLADCDRKCWRQDVSDVATTCESKLPAFATEANKMVEELRGLLEGSRESHDMASIQSVLTRVADGIEAFVKAHGSGAGLQDPSRESILTAVGGVRFYVHKMEKITKGYTPIGTDGYVGRDDGLSYPAMTPATSFPLLWRRLSTRQWSPSDVLWALRTGVAVYELGLLFVLGAYVASGRMH